MMSTRAARASMFDEHAVLALNRAHEAETSPLDEIKLRSLLVMAAHVGSRDDGRTAFLLAFDEAAEYDNANFAWFKLRYRRFFYIDRVIVSGESRGRGIARSLYQELFDLAARNSCPVIGCEINVEPQNPRSDAFHAAMGFSEAGRAQLSSHKIVRYMVRSISTQGATLCNS